MPTLQIADKPTLDSINNKIDNITSSLSAITEKVNNSGGTIKSVQRGTISLDGSTLTNTATISAVDTSKAFVVYTGSTYVNRYGGSVSNAVMLSLTNSTTVKATKSSSDSSSDTMTVPYQVVEYN